jgi:hypothetical protein
MNETTRDPLLLEAFDAAREDLADEAMTRAVLARTTKSRWLRLGVVGAVALAVLLTSWLALGVTLQDFAFGIADALMTPLVDLGEGWLAFFLLPVNTVGSLLVLVLKLLRMGWKRATGAALSI